MNIIYSNEFDYFDDDQKSRVFEIFPNVFNDDRGYFCEVLKVSNGWSQNDNIPMWFSNLSWIRQINRSKSSSYTVRGCHAQKGIYCQGKLVSALTNIIYDIITDARPDSNTFGTSKVFILYPDKQNQLWVPHGFLHTFVTTSKENSIFEYYCDNVFNKESEIGVSPMSILPNIISELEVLMKNSNFNNEFLDLINIFKEKTALINLSKKDQQAIEYSIWMKNIKNEYLKDRKIWYK